MIIHYDQETDVLTVVVEEEPVARTVEFEYGIADLNGAGEVVAVELYGAKDLIKGAMDIAQGADLPDALRIRLRELVAQVQSQLREAASGLQR